jgi:hypothetical protein
MTRSIKGQSDIAQQRRLRLGRCPVHGLDLSPEDARVYDGEEDVGQYATCPRQDCSLSFVVTGIQDCGEIEGVRHFNMTARRMREGEQVKRKRHSSFSELEESLARVQFHRNRRRGVSKETYENKMQKLRDELLLATATALLEVLEPSRRS